jgi:hypothetical protein
MLFAGGAWYIVGLVRVRATELLARMGTRGKPRMANAAQPPELHKQGQRRRREAKRQPRK